MGFYKQQAIEESEREERREIRARGFRSAEDMQTHDYCMATYGASPVESGHARKPSMFMRIFVILALEDAGARRGEYYRSNKLSFENNEVAVQTCDYGKYEVMCEDRFWVQLHLRSDSVGISHLNGKVLVSIPENELDDKLAAEIERLKVDKVFC